MRINRGIAAVRCIIALGLLLLMVAAVASANTLPTRSDGESLRFGSVGASPWSTGFGGAQTLPGSAAPTVRDSSSVDVLGTLCSFIEGASRSRQLSAPFSMVVNCDPSYPDSPRNIAILERDVDTVNNLPDQPAGVIFAGDLIVVDNQSVALADQRFAKFKEIHARLKMPYYPVIGSHDMCQLVAY